MFRVSVKKDFFQTPLVISGIDRQPSIKKLEDDYLEMQTSFFQNSVESLVRWFIGMFLMKSKFHSFDRENLNVMELWLDYFRKNRIMPCEQKANQLLPYFQDINPEDYLAATFLEYNRKLKDTKAFVDLLWNHLADLQKKRGLSRFSIDTSSILLFSITHNSEPLFNQFVKNVTINKNLYLVVKKLIDKDRKIQLEKLKKYLPEDYRAKNNLELLASLSTLTLFSRTSKEKTSEHHDYKNQQGLNGQKDQKGQKGQKDQKDQKDQEGQKNQREYKEHKVSPVSHFTRSAVKTASEREAKETNVLVSAGHRVVGLGR